MTGVIELLDGEISQRHMLNHPFYQRWNAGELTRGELEEYSRQYYPYTLAFPTFLSAMHAHTDDIAIRQYLLENLIEEERGTENHPAARKCTDCGGPLEPTTEPETARA